MTYRIRLFKPGGIDPACPSLRKGFSMDFSLEMSHPYEGREVVEMLEEFITPQTEITVEPQGDPTEELMKLIDEAAGFNDPHLLNEADLEGVK